MSSFPLIECESLAVLLATGSQSILVCDCRFELSDPAAGAAKFAQGHIPGAIFVDLEKSLTGSKTGNNGRHPLPLKEEFASAMAKFGANSDTYIIVYDADDSMFAARLWWMLRWIGHANVSVLNGGLRKWIDAGYAVTTEIPQRTSTGNINVHCSLTPTRNYEEVRNNVSDSKFLVVDARSPDRFNGRNETMDPLGGHIPGARNRFFKDNLTVRGEFKSPDELRREFSVVLRGYQATRTICQCGSGVTACHNLLAMEVAGLHGGTLYPGSWSEWCVQPDALIATGG